MTTLVRYIKTLFRAAESPSLQQVLQSNMFISRISGQTRTVKLPASVDEWKLLLEVASHEYVSGHVGYKEKLLTIFGTKKRVCPVHAECALLHYLQTKHGNDWDNVAAFSYIGVSKLSCSSCRIWIEVFNQQNNGLKFYTRGSHGKWYWPWGMPAACESLEQEIFRKMAEKIIDEYHTYLASPADKSKRVPSDSTIASSSDEGSIPDSKVSEVFTANTAAAAQTIGHPAGGVIDTLMRIPDRKREKGMRK